jgi:hypothetical protein
MQTPGSKTSPDKCIRLSLYAQRMLGKYPQNLVFVDAADKLKVSTDTLDAAQKAYMQAVLDIILARVDLKFADVEADREVSNLQRRTVLADGEAGGPIEAAVFPEGSTAIVKGFGQTEIDSLSALEGRLHAQKDNWNDALKEEATIADYRSKYEGALAARASAKKNARDLRAVRDAARESYVTTYTKVTFLVKAEYPRNTKMQDLFFDVVERDDETVVDAPEEEPKAPPEGEPIVKPA